MRQSSAAVGRPLYVLALRSGAPDEARDLLRELEAAGAVPWMMTLARAEGLARTGELKAAIEDVQRLPVEMLPPSGVIYTIVVMRYLAGARDPELERWLLDHICE